MYKPKPDPVVTEQMTVYFHYAEILQYLWDKYVQTVNAMIGGAGATIFIVVQIMISETRIGIDGSAKPDLIIYSLIAGLLSLMFAAAWRVTTQFKMEKEVFGSPSLTQWYFDISGLTNNVTPVVHSPRWRWVSVAHLFVGLPAVVCLIASWVLVGLHVLVALRPITG